MTLSDDHRAGRRLHHIQFRILKRLRTADLTAIAGASALSADRLQAILANAGADLTDAEAEQLERALNDAQAKVP